MILAFLASAIMGGGVPPVIGAVPRPACNFRMLQSPGICECLPTNRWYEPADNAEPLYGPPNNAERLFNEKEPDPWASLVRMRLRR